MLLKSTEIKTRELLNFKYLFPHLKKYFTRGLSEVKKTWKIVMLELKILKLYLLIFNILNLLLEMKE